MLDNNNCNCNKESVGKENASTEKTFDSSCIFCKIIAGEIPCQKVYEDEHTIAFKDLHPKATVHILVVPKTHAADITGIDNFYMGKITDTIKHLAAELNLKDKGFRVISNCGAAAGQSVFHLHFHVLSGKYERFE